MARVSPVGFKELLQLTELSVQATDIKFKNVGLQSSKYITVREENNGQLIIIEIATKNILRLPIKIESAIMNPVSKVIALRVVKTENGASKDALQIYNLEMKSLMNNADMQNVAYWKWIDPKTIAIVTDSSVYHWSMDGKGQPKKMFDREVHSSPVQIISYHASEDHKWLMLGGIAAAPGGGGVVGVLQVYSVDAGASQPTMDAHAACFARFKLDGRDAPSTIFCFTRVSGDTATLQYIEIGVPRDQAFKKQASLELKSGDFPVAMLPDNKHGSVFIISKLGILYLFELQSGKCIFQNQASRVTMFTSCLHDDDGIVTVDQNGRVAHFYMDEKNVVPYVTSVLNDYELGVGIAQRYNLPGAEKIFVEQFQRLMQQQRYDAAMQLAADSPQGVLRTVDTMNQFKQIPGQPNAPAPLLQYFALLLKKGPLNQVEAVELARGLLAKNAQAGLTHIQTWLKESKLECSEDLGDLLKSHDITLALSVYGRAKVSDKVIGCYLALAARESDSAAATAHFQNIFTYAKKFNYKPDYPLLVSQLLRVSPDRAKDFALLLLSNTNDDSGASVDIRTLLGTFMQSGDVKNTTNILLKYFQNVGDREEDADLQTKLLEINLLSMPNVADFILESNEYKLTHYDRQKVAQLCERAHLYQRALEHYDELDDIKRVLSNAHLINPEFLMEYFGRMTPEKCLSCLRDLLKYSQDHNMRLVVEVAKKWNEYLTPEKLIELFEEINSYHGLYFYLTSFVNFTKDSKVVFKYIQAAVELKQLREVERVCRDNDVYDPAEVKAYLLDKNLSDPRPLIHVCDRFDFVDELTHYLYSNNMFAFIEAYVSRMNPRAAPAVVGALLSLNANEEQIRELITGVRPPVEDAKFIGRLVDACESHGRLKLLQSWLEARAGGSENNTSVDLHNGLAKIYVETNQSPQHFLTTNQHYDSKVIGEFCESRDPHLSVIAYKRGRCDQELIAVTSKHGFFKDQARYLVERQNLELWATVLVDTNEHRRALIDQVVATALPEAKNPEEVSTSVKAFMAANLPNELIELLERIILQGPTDSQFHKNKNLQNLLILTAIKADKKRVMDYVNRLDNYDGPDIAKIAISEQYQLYEEAFFIYKKFKFGAEAIEVLLNHIKDIPRAVEFAEYWDKAPVWSILGKAQLQAELVKEGIESFLKADDAKEYVMVINLATKHGLFTELINFLLMARTKMKETLVDNELIYSYAKTKRLSELEDFIATPNQAKLEVIGDRCYQETLYEAGRILFTHINNNAKLAMCLVKLKLFQEAYDAAKKANNITTWKAVCYACVDNDKFRLAQMCAMNIIVINEQLLDLIRYYELRGHTGPLIQLLEQGINLERAHQGIYTQLGILYAKYKRDKLLEHVKLFWAKLNIPTLLQVCQQNQHWPETVFLFTHYQQYDNAVNAMIEHSTECWNPDTFKEVVAKAATDLYYRAIDFYLTEHPLLLNELLLELLTNLDHARVVRQVTDRGHLPLIQKYLQHVQSHNAGPDGDIAAVNEALNSLYLEEEDYRALRESIDMHNSFDQLALAQATEKHPLLEFRRISAYLYKLNKRWDKSIALSKNDELWGDAMQTASESKEPTLAEELLRFFVESKRPECFSACLFTCYELIPPHVVLELSWRQGLMHFAMPYMVQSIQDLSNRVGNLERRLEEQGKKVDETKAAQTRDNVPPPLFMGNGMPAPLAIMPPPPGFGSSMMPPPSYGPQYGGGYN